MKSKKLLFYFINTKLSIFKYYSVPFLTPSCRYFMYVLFKKNMKLVKAGSRKKLEALDSAFSSDKYFLAI